MSVTAGTIICRLCMEPIRVHFTRTGDDPDDWVGLVVTKAPLIAHMATCRPNGASIPIGRRFVQAPDVPKRELEGRITQFLNTDLGNGRRMFVVEGGSRACTMCGENGGMCMQYLYENGGTCCAACRNGNTHPAPQEAYGVCGEWGAEYGVGAPSGPEK